MTAHVSRAKLFAAFAAIYIIWGSTYLAIKFAVQSIPPFMVGATRFLVAGAVLYGWARWQSGLRPTRKQWIDGLVLGVFLLGVGNGCVVWAQQRTPSGITALIVAIVPLLVVLIDWWRPGGKNPGAAAIVGVVIGLAGMALLIGPSAVLGAGDIAPIAALVLLAGSLSWSAATVFGKRASVPPAPLLAAAIQLLGGALSLTIVSLVAGELARVQPAEIPLRATLSVLYLIVFGSIIAFSAYSWLLRVAQPAKISTYAYVNPIVAMFLGWAFAGEELTARVLMAAAIVLTGVALITRRTR
ncbi:MAG TPA: EamA family transporter [Longimicrobiales bacterium]|nr:EamA family transporter [Longimicrobiales bacterium]